MNPTAPVLKKRGGGWGGSKRGEEKTERVFESNSESPEVQNGIKAGSLKVGEFLESNREDLELELLTDEASLASKITDSDIFRPGLVLAGYTEVFLHHRIQIFGETEVSFLATLSDRKRREAIDRFFVFQLPCIIVTKKLPVPEDIRTRANEKGIPVLRTPWDTTPFIHRLSGHLEDYFAPTINIHGTLVDVYGIGLLYTGESGIGKSEVALDLVERGHRLVADDVVTIQKQARGILIGRASPILKHYMEIRGIGIIDVQSIFGIRAIRLQKRIEVEVSLKLWDSGESYERLGLDEDTSTILGTKIARVTIPLVPGKNITVISEVVALHHLLKIYGRHPAEEFNRRLMKIMENKIRTTSFLQGDTE
ncbi:HPr(Ser) kinase/phosphatase [candidate division KSB1 bacterium]